jgi:hypothetical protein
VTIVLDVPLWSLIRILGNWTFCMLLFSDDFCENTRHIFLPHKTEILSYVSNSKIFPIRLNPNHFFAQDSCPKSWNPNPFTLPINPYTIAPITCRHTSESFSLLHQSHVQNHMLVSNSKIFSIRTIHLHIIHALHIQIQIDIPCPRDKAIFYKIQLHYCTKIMSKITFPFCDRKLKSEHKLAMHIQHI